MFVLNVQSLPLRGQGLSINRSNFATFCDVLRIRLVIWVWSFPGGEWECIALLFVYLSISTVPGADPGFQIRGEHLKKLRRAEGGAKIVGVFRVKNHDFTPKNHFFSNFRGARAGCAPPPGSVPVFIYLFLSEMSNFCADFKEFFNSIEIDVYCYIFYSSPGQRSMWPLPIYWCLSVIRRSLSHLNLLIWNHWT
jgi:hypothetical protein